MTFPEQLDHAAEFLNSVDDITFISHADADGISATAIMHRLCDELGKKHSTFFLSQVSSPALERLSEQVSGTVIFVDLGASHLDIITDLFQDMELLVLDHHQAQGENTNVMINPTTEGLDGTRCISTSGMAYQVAKRVLDDATSLIPLGIIGAQGDNQEPGGFEEFNKEMLDDGIEANLISTRGGARLYGIHSRKIVKLLMKSYDLKLPDLRSPKGARDFLRSLNIEPYDDGGERWFTDLTDEEQELIETTLIEESPHPEPEITHYTLTEMPEGPLQDSREASTLLNACGRLGKPELGVRMVLLDESAVARIADLQREYGQTLHRAHRWYDHHKEDIIEQEDLVILRAKNSIPADLAGTLCSVISRGREVSPLTTVICLARNTDGTDTTKVSSRSLAGQRDLAAWLSETAAEVGGEGGGHKVAAGAVIPTENEDAFIELLLN